nr:DNA (cytosine-5)-methyltransferase 1-like [Ipomoea trifida]
MLVNQPRGGRDSTICFMEYMFQSSDGTKVAHHRRVMVGAFETVLGNNTHKKELCQIEYLPRFPSLQRLGNRHCHSCKARKSQEEKNTFWYSESTINFTYQGIHYEALDFLYTSPSHFEESQNGNQSVIEDDEDSMPKAM